MCGNEAASHWEMKISAPAIEYLLTTWPVARLATLNLDGSPHQVPIVFTWLDGRFWSPVDGKPKRKAELTRIRNITANPVASLLIDAYDSDWNQLWWIRADVEISVVRFDEADQVTLATATHAKEKLLLKYPQYANIPVLRPPATMLRMVPTAFTSWCATAVKPESEDS